MLKIKVKPLQLVHVDKPGYQYIGQVMSFTTPEHTAMVRRVPGHPGTLEEIDIGFLKEVYNPRRFKWVQYAMILGRGSFPVDMLRYDVCAPVNFKLLDEGYGEKAIIDPTFGHEELLIAAVTERKNQTWTTDRWMSFMWNVKHLKTEQFPLGE